MCAFERLIMFTQKATIFLINFLIKQVHIHVNIHIKYYTKERKFTEQTWLWHKTCVHFICIFVKYILYIFLYVTKKKIIGQYNKMN